MKWYIILFGWMNGRASVQVVQHIPRIFQASERVRSRRCGAAISGVRDGTTY
jgi:hypothetical protein